MATGAFDGGELDAACAGDTSAAWRFIRIYCRTWRGPLAAGDGWGDDDLSAAEARLGVRLPPAVRDAYGLFGRRRDLTSLQDRLLAPDELVWDDRGEVLQFRWENQGVTSWGVPRAALDRPDPPVVFRTPDGWEPFLDAFSLACIEMVLSESLFADPIELGDNRDLDDACVGRLEAHFARLAIPDYPMGTGGGPLRWFGGDDVMLRNDADTWLWVRARTAAALDAVRAALPGDWLMTAD